MKKITLSLKDSMVVDEIDLFIEQHNQNNPRNKITRSNFLELAGHKLLNEKGWEFPNEYNSAGLIPLDESDFKDMFHIKKNIQDENISKDMDTEIKIESKKDIIQSNSNKKTNLKEETANIISAIMINKKTNVINSDMFRKEMAIQCTHTSSKAFNNRWQLAKDLFLETSDVPGKFIANEFKFMDEYDRIEEEIEKDKNNLIQSEPVKLDSKSESIFKAKHSDDKGNAKIDRW